MENAAECKQTEESQICVSGIRIEWLPKQGTCTFENMPVTMMWVDTTLAGLMSGIQAMVGTERFILALHSEGRKSVEADWEVISKFQDFRRGFNAIANIAAVAGWGHWELISVDQAQRECRFRVKDSWEGRYQKAIGVCWGSGMLAGKMAGYCSKLFETNCWADQTAFIANGDAYDEFVVKPSSRLIEKEIEGLLASDEATRADMAVTLRNLEQEIAERKRAEDALQRSQQLFFTIFRANPAAIILSSLTDGKCVDANDAYARLVGYTREELVGKTTVELNIWRSVEERHRVVSELAQKGHLENVELSLRRKNGQFIDTVAAGDVITLGGKQYILSFFFDITERKQAEEALRRYELLSGYIRDIILFMRRDDGRILEANAAAIRAYGYSHEELLTMTIHDLRAIDTRRLTAGQMAEADTQGILFETVHRRKDGSTFPVEVSSRGATIGGTRSLISVVRDVTMRKQAEEALQFRTTELEHLTETLDQRVQERTAELAKANEALRHLSSKLLSAQEEERKKIASEIHDTLGACLTGIKYKVETVLQQIGKKKSAAAESLKTLIPIIQEGVEECRRMQMDLRPSMLDDLGLLPTLSWFCRQFQTIYSGIRIEQEIKIREGDVPHPLKIVAFRVIQEAMNNIAKHSHANLVRLSLMELDGRIELVLRDNGRGFNLDKVRSFETAKRGMGLTSMRERMELSGGSIAIESTEGKGTIIRASWPLHQNS